MLYSCVKLETNLAIRNCGTVYLQELFVLHLNRSGGEFLSEVRFISAQVNLVGVQPLVLAIFRCFRR